MKRVTRVIGMFVPGLLLCGCTADDKPVGTPVEQAWERPAAPSVPAPAPADVQAPGAGSPQTAPATEPAQFEVIAVVNGTPITRQAMVDMLLRSHGLSLLEQLVLLTAARQRASEMALEVTRGDIQEAHEDALRRLAAPVGGIEDQALDRVAAERLLAEFLLAKNISRSEWDRRMEQQAYLRKIAAAEADKIDVTEEMLRDEYVLEYGERAQVRHIQVASLQAAARVRAALAAPDVDLTTQPATRSAHDTALSRKFELVARQYSDNQLTAARGGLMPPFTRNDPTVTPLIREAAFSLEVGQISPPINEGTAYHILLLERLFPASDVGYENADRAALRRRFLDRRIRQRQEALEAELFQAAVVDVRDAQLGRQFRSRYRPSAR